MDKKNLEGLYEAWSSKSADAIDYDIEALIRKEDVISSHIPSSLLANFRSVLDFGCGYGAVLHCRWIGGGGYFCLATFDSKYMLTP